MAKTGTIKSSSENQLELPTELETAHQEILRLRETNRELKQRVLDLSQQSRSQSSLISVLLERFPFGVVLLNEQQTILQINKAAEEMLNVSRSLVVGNRCTKLFDCYSAEGDCPILNGQNMDRVETVCANQGTTAKQLLRSVVATDTQGGKVIIEGFIDISEIKAAEQEKELNLHAKDEFLALISHEFRTPLNAILGYASLFKDEYVTKLDDNASGYIQCIEDAGNMLLHVVEGMLEISDLNAGKVKPNKVPIDIHGFISEIEYLFADKMTAKGNKLRVHHEDVPVFLQDPVRIARILEELLINANKFTRHGIIDLNVTMDGKGYIRFSVQDTGCGIAREKLKDIFNTFRQADNTYTRNFDGMGLGLTIVEKLVNLLDGVIEVSSEIDKGSTFSFLLPFEAADV